MVALSVPYVAAPPVPNKGQTWNLNMTGSGAAIIFQNGKRIDGTWTTDGSTPPKFYDASGNEIFLKSGKTWFQVPNDISKIVVTTGHPEIDDPEAAAAAAAASNTGQDYQAADAADTDE